MEDRFLTLEKMHVVSGELEAAGFKHVLTRHHIDPEWRRQCRPHRPELEPISWTVRVNEFLIPMPQLKSLVDICERHDLVFWVGSRSPDDEGIELYMADSKSTAVRYGNK